MVKPFFFVLVCFAALAHAQDRPGFLSIDCGLSDNSTYQDGKTGIYYVSDAGFMNTNNGISKSISSLYQTNDLDQQLVNVRSFPQGTKNCYTLKPPRLQGRRRYFIRARFLYGNYDMKNQLPSFDLYFGVDYWTTVGFADGSTPVDKEILHVPSSTSDDIYVCLVNIGYGTPFISALEVRLVDDTVYQIKSGSLKLVGRYDMRAYANRLTTRYNDDVFDRLWKPSFLEDDVTELSTQININGTHLNDYKLPSIVMQTAIAPLNASEPIKFRWKPSDPTAGYYLYMHFTDFQSSLIREFNIIINNLTWFEHLRPGYLDETTIYSPGPRPPAPLVNFTLIKTSNSTLAPILNAIEIYTVKQFSYQLTDTKDVNALEEIKAFYGLKKDWQGDPCLPANYSWEGIGCYNISSDADPRIISLNLSSSGLTGKISSLLSDLKMLQSLDLSNNSLMGGLPDFLTELDLVELILSGNNLSGIIPPKLIERKKSGTLNLRVEGNPNLCEPGQCGTNTNSTSPPSPPPPPPKKKFSIFIIIAAVVAVLVILIIIGAVLSIIHIRKRKSPEQQVVVSREPTTSTPITSNAGNSSNSGVAPFKMTQQQFTYSEVVRITTNFQREVGKGGFGTVYHGYLDNNQVAVKMLSSTSNQGYRQFRAEAELLTRVHHRNLTTLVGYCDEGDKQALIYEYMAKSDLRSHLSERNVNVLSWVKRLKVVVDAAQGLEYLHMGCVPPIIHRDIKSTNILLNNEFQAKLADFGLSKVFPREGATHMSTGFAGTPGYLDPEYNINEKSDVFSFGIVLLEIITGRPPISKSPERVYLYKWVNHMIATSGDIRNVVDPRLNNEYDINAMWKAVDVAMECVSNTSNKRPSMNQVVIELKRCLAMENEKFNNGESSPYDSIEMSSLNIDATGMNPSAR